MRFGGVIATTLRDGRVLMVGAVYCPSSPSCAGIERRISVVYDASVGFDFGPRLLDDRDGLFAIALPDSRVLFVGLHGYGKPAFAEVYDPGADAFVAAGRTDESWHALYSATLLPDGRVLFIFDAV